MLSLLLTTTILFFIVAIVAIWDSIKNRKRVKQFKKLIEEGSKYWEHDRWY